MNKESSRRQKNTQPAWESRPTRRLRWARSARKPWRPWQSESKKKATRKDHQKCDAEFDKMSDRNFDENCKNNLTRILTMNPPIYLLTSLTTSPAKGLRRNSTLNATASPMSTSEKVGRGTTSDTRILMRSLAKIRWRLQWGCWVPELFEKFKSGLHDLIYQY